MEIPVAHQGRTGNPSATQLATPLPAWLATSGSIPVKEVLMVLHFWKSSLESQCCPWQSGARLLHRAVHPCLPPQHPLPGHRGSCEAGSCTVPCASWSAPGPPTKGREEAAKGFLVQLRDTHLGPGTCCCAELPTALLQPRSRRDERVFLRDRV